MRLDSAQDLRDELLSQMPANAGVMAYAALAPHKSLPSATDLPVVGPVIDNAIAGVGALLRPAVGALSHAVPIHPAPLHPPAIGIAPSDREGDYRIAVRIPEGWLSRTPLVSKIRRAARGEVDVRVVGVIKAHNDDWQCRARPVEIGYSVGHGDITGTAGCFVHVPGDRAVHLLSCNHVLAACGQATVGAPILQPGPLDGGRVDVEEDVIGRLSHFEPLRPDAPNPMDIALCSLEEAAVPPDPRRVGDRGRLAEVSDPPLGELVEKVGRTTGWTQGTVSAFGMRLPSVQYPHGLWLSLDDQVEIEGTNGIFSEEGDSGAVVHSVEKRAAVAVLNCGTAYGLSYASPLPMVFTRLGLTLAG